MTNTMMGSRTFVYPVLFEYVDFKIIALRVPGYQTLNPSKRAVPFVLICFIEYSIDSSFRCTALSAFNFFNVS
jgi:hypothetical protein